MTPPETTWEEKIRLDYGGILSPEQIKGTIDYWREFIRAEKTKSYQEGLEKAKEILKGMERKDADPLHSYMPNVVNQTLSEAEEKINQEIGKL